MTFEAETPYRTIPNAWLTLGNWLSASSVNFAVTVPNSLGYTVAFLSECVISFAVMAIVLWLTNFSLVARYTGVIVGCVLALYITFEAPLSGMSMNPARTLGSAIPANVFTGLWIYFLAPSIGMLTAAELYLRRHGADVVDCAKL